ncbi:hypothetical protein NWE60_02145 [Mycoplasmopsis felis]|uniref:hypothetical protein n=1 Tax=Mycoplasmopsis felis TaxID=33923 RepID=UPI0021E05971|nr:hypothetical protein [Mycoplasmopsis felis]MCU9938976.1 hypothetical protein [Mycoplasmopsis felis]WAM01413.1 hypothetical protein NWE60_02145 [Mycoplasmopsis felis]
MYPEIKNHPNKTYREYWLINNLDFSLFTKLSSAAENFLKKGETLDPRNAYITENGEWESHSYSPPDEFNTVTTLRIRDNQHKRAFGYDHDMVDHLLILKKVDMMVELKLMLKIKRSSINLISKT